MIEESLISLHDKDINQYLLKNKIKLPYDIVNKLKSEWLGLSDEELGFSKKHRARYGLVVNGNIVRSSNNTDNLTPLVKEGDKWEAKAKEMGLKLTEEEAKALGYETAEKLMQAIDDAVAAEMGRRAEENAEQANKAVDTICSAKTLAFCRYKC